MNKLFHAITFPECTADAVTALCDEQVTAVRSFFADMLISNGQQSIKSNVSAQCKASNYLQMT